MKKTLSYLVLLATVTLVGCGTKTTQTSLDRQPNMTASEDFVVDFGEQVVVEKSVEDYLMEAEAAKEKLRVLLEKKAEMEAQDTASLLNWIIPTVSAQADEENLEAQIASLLEEIETAIENAEEIAQTPEEVETVQATAETITEEVEAVAEDAEVDTVVQKMKMDWKSRLAGFEERFMERFKLTGDRQAEFVKRRAEHKADLEARKAEREQIKAAVEAGEMTPEAAQENMKAQHEAWNKDRKEKFMQRLEWLKKTRPSMVDKLEEIKIERETKATEMKLKADEIKAAIESGEMTETEAKDEFETMRKEAREEHEDMMESMKMESSDMMEKSREDMREKMEDRLEKMEDRNPEVAEKMKEMMEKHDDMREKRRGER